MGLFVMYYKKITTNSSRKNTNILFFIHGMLNYGPDDASCTNTVVIAMTTHICSLLKGTHVFVTLQHAAAQLSTLTPTHHTIYMHVAHH